MANIPSQAAPYSTTAALTKASWDAKLREEAVTQDIFSDNAGLYNENTRQLPDAIVAKVKGDTTVRTIGMLNRLSGEGVVGGGELRGNEEAQTTRELTLKVNELAHGVPTKAYGLDAVKQDPYGLYAMAQPQLATWYKEKKGKMIRQAIVEKFDGVQIDGTVRTAAESKVNPNVYVPNSSSALDVPVAWNSTEATFVDNLYAAMTSATATGLSKAALDKIEEFAWTRFQVEPVTINGKKSYILTVPSRQKTKLLAAGTGTYLQLLADADVRGENNQGLSHVFAKYGSLYLCEEPRQVIAKAISGGTGDHDGSTNSISFQYKGQGFADTRELTVDATHFDVAMLLGKGAVIDYVVEELHFEDELQNYKRDHGIGAFMTRGYTRPDFNIAAGTSMRNQGSGLIICDLA